jgi:hypothetical protein
MSAIESNCGGIISMVSSFLQVEKKNSVLEKQKNKRNF